MDGPRRTASDFAKAAGVFAADSAANFILIDYLLNERETGDSALARLRDHFARSVHAADHSEIVGARSYGPAAIRR